MSAPKLLSIRIQNTNVIVINLFIAENVGTLKSMQ